MLRDLIDQIESRETMLQRDDPDALLDLQQSKHTIQVPVPVFSRLLKLKLKLCQRK